MKTTLTIFAAIVMPGGLIVLAIAAITFLVTRHRARARAAAAQMAAAAPLPLSAETAAAA